MEQVPFPFWKKTMALGKAPRYGGGVKHVHHWRRHRRNKIEEWEKEIWRLQASTDLLLRKLPFQHLVREITQTNLQKHEMRFQSSALLAMQEAAEYNLVRMFEESYLLMIHAKCVTLKLRDIQLRNRLMGVSSKMPDWSGENKVHAELDAELKRIREDRQKSREEEKPRQKKRKQKKPKKWNESLEPVRGKFMQQLVGQSNEENTPAVGNTANLFDDPESLMAIDGLMPSPPPDTDSRPVQ